MNYLNICRREFEKGLEARRAAPLHEGMYKLEESARYPERALQNLDELMERKRNREPLRSIDAGDQVAYYLKLALKGLSFRAGKDLLGGIAALPGDGVPQAVLDRQLPYFQQRVDHLIITLQMALNDLWQQGVKVEYARWPQLDSVLFQPCWTFQQIVADGVSLMQYAPKHCTSTLLAP